eukprot:14661234-Alexandrium_andersonii.AAC.1
MHPSGAPGANFEAAVGPPQFQVRTPEAILHFTHGRLRIEADCGNGGPRRGPWSFGRVGAAT